jgi:hypothetical protein
MTRLLTERGISGLALAGSAPVRCRSPHNALPHLFGFPSFSYSSPKQGIQKQIELAKFPDKAQ